MTGAEWLLSVCWVPETPMTHRHAQPRSAELLDSDEGVDEGHGQPV
jgi:hypothetical protein